ncbi:MAG: hypothetical protein ACFFDV_08220 [Candidatus Thorarchaeota archaeon]
MTEAKMYVKTTSAGWLVVGCLLSLIVAIIWILTDPITTLIMILGIGLGIGIAFIIIVNEALILTTVQTLQKAGESAVNLLSLRKNMRAVLAIWIFGLFTIVVLMTLFNQLELDKFSAIMGVLGGFVASVVAYYFASSKNETTP